MICSYHNYLKPSIPDEFTGTVDDFCDLFVKGNILFGPWWDLVNQFANLENVHFIHYEDLIEVNLRIKSFISV